MSHPRPISAGALLTIDLEALCDNWRLLKAQLAGAECAAVVKADAYGLGALQVAPALWRAGCRRFFVAHLDEAITLRPALPADASIHVLNGPPPGTEPEFVDHRVVPVLNSLAQIAAWRALALRLQRRLPASVHVDTGMARLGLAGDELARLAGDADALAGVCVDYILSHLVSAEDPACPINRIQLERFAAARRQLPPARASLANSSGIFLGPDYHFDLARPGAALYGVAPVAGRDNPMRPVVRLQGRVIQLRTIAAGTSVGYGHTWTATRRSRIATVAVGYADGYLRSLSNRGHACFDGIRLPLVGNVSMDTTLVDVTELGEGRIREGALIDLIGPANGIDEVARCAGTIGYEILTSLGQRYARAYLPDRRAPQ